MSLSPVKTIVALLLVAPAVRAADSPINTTQPAYAPIHNLHLYYEIHNPTAPGTPLVLLHGGGSTIQTSFAKLLPLLAKSRKTIAFEQQGHGHTADIPNRPFSFEQSADDTAALLD